MISNGRHAILGDEPIPSKGTDLGFSPPELVLAGIAMCKVATIRNVARRNGWEIGEVDAKLSQEVRRQKDRTLKTTVKTEYHIEGDITQEQYDHLTYEADNCYVTRMIKGEWDLQESEVLEAAVNS